MQADSGVPVPVDALAVLEPKSRLLRDLRTSTRGLNSREAERRLIQFGPNVLSRRARVQWPREIARQLAHPLAVLLWVAAGLSFAVGSEAVGIAVVLVIVLNAAFAFVQELQALGRDPAEPGIMNRPPRQRQEGVIRAPMLVRAWLFLGMIFGQIGTAFAVRTHRASLWSVGVFSNRYLLLAVAAELAVAAVLVYAPPLQSLLGTAAPPAHYLVLLIPYPLIVLGADELRKLLVRHG